MIFTLGWQGCADGRTFWLRIHPSFSFFFQHAEPKSHTSNIIISLY